VVSFHLSLVPERRPREMAEVLAETVGLRGPVVLAGDLNETETGPAWRAALDHGFVDPGSDAWPTFPSDQPAAPDRRAPGTRSADGARARRPGRAAALQAAASDHRAILAELSLSPDLGSRDATPSH
jgi:endonuclease/exonuclease/phosphatase family metal-dependent hydrolase